MKKVPRPQQDRRVSGVLPPEAWILLAEFMREGELTQEEAVQVAVYNLLGAWQLEKQHRAEEETVAAQHEQSRKKMIAWEGERYARASREQEPG